jgi:hypothetical protein
MCLPKAAVSQHDQKEERKEVLPLCRVFSFDESYPSLPSMVFNVRKLRQFVEIFGHPEDPSMQSRLTCFVV